MSSIRNPTYDVVIIGGGPAGATAAIILARAGRRVVLLEKDSHPRFHIGESILPRNTALLRELGLDAELAKIPHVPKYGAEFGFGNDFQTMRFSFSDGFVPGLPVFNVERSVFDRMLIEQARRAGAEVRENTAVRAITRLDEGDVEVQTTASPTTAVKAGAAVGEAPGTICGRIVLDGSGHGTVVARHLGQRKPFDDPELQKVAYFQHFDGVERLPGEATGHPTIIMADEGWFWLIGLNENRTSVGFVTRPRFARTVDVPPERLLQWAVARCPVVRHRMRSAIGDPANRVLADFSYKCVPLAGPGFFLVGDAGAFLDPIFSTGVTLAMVGAQEAARLVLRMFEGKISPVRARRAYTRFVEGSTGVFWGLIRNYYRHPFRELFMHGQGPFQVHRAVISILAGQVFPKPIHALRWRLRFFQLCVKVQERFALVPRRPRFRLTDELPNELPQFSDCRVSVPREFAAA